MNKNKLQDYLNAYYTKQGQTQSHTRIPDEGYGIKGGSFCIPDDEALMKFYKLYVEHVFVNKKEEYLTEKQQRDGPILIDFDFRYNTDVTNRMHNDEHITNILEEYLDIIKNMLIIRHDESFPIYVFQKPNVNKLLDKTKDGIHIIIGINMNRSLQILLREKVLNVIGEGGVWEDLGNYLTNSWDAVIDSGVVKGTVNWQLYGSRKPGHEAYKLYKWYNVELDSADDEWILEENVVADFDIKLNFSKLSAQYKNHICFEMQERVRPDFERIESENNNRRRKGLKVKDPASKTLINFPDINSDEILDRALEQLFDRIKEKPDEYKLKEVHEYAMILPEKYYGPGSYDNWMRVGWALRNTGFELYLTWLKLSSQSSEFDWGDVGNLWRHWRNMNRDNDGLTERSIMYWARNDCDKNLYEKVKSNSLDFYMDIAIDEPSDYTIAQVLYYRYRDEFVFASFKGKKWYQYDGNRWTETPEGHKTREAMSKDIYSLFTKKISDRIMRESEHDPSSDEFQGSHDKTKTFRNLCPKLRDVTHKNKFLTESQEQFFMPDFIEKLDSNNNLLCFNNGVVDFSETDKDKIFRKGRPEDYNSKSTKIDYIPLDRERDAEIIAEINTFMYQLFPKDSLRKYMWEHLASVLIGRNKNQRFNIYTGAGRNGKSCLVELMSKILGEYKGTVPVTLVTDKRGTIGGTSSEVAQLQGVRYAVMQEPEKGASMNEGIMKELTGGDPIQARALWSDSITFIPQFKLVCTLNNLFDVKSNDEGTWRRIRICPFESLFTEKPQTDDPEKPYQFEVDFNMEDKFERWKNVFMSMLVDLAFETKGMVEDVEIVLSASNSYRANQDHFAEFIQDNIIPSKGDTIGKQDISREFKEWYKSNHGNNVPKAKELYDMMDKKYKWRNNKWIDIKIREDDNKDEESSDSEVEEEPEC